MGSNLSDDAMTARALGCGAESVMFKQAVRIAYLEDALRAILSHRDMGIGPHDGPGIRLASIFATAEIALGVRKQE